MHDKVCLLHDVPLLHHAVSRHAENPREGRRQLSNEAVGGAPKQRESKHDAAEQLQRKLPLYRWRKHCDEIWVDGREALLMDVLPQVVLDSALQVLRHPTPSHEASRLGNPGLNRISKGLLCDMRQPRHDGAKEDRRHHHHEDCIKSGNCVLWADVPIADSGHRHEHPVCVLHVEVPPSDGIGVVRINSSLCQTPSTRHQVHEKHDRDKNLDWKQHG
mmetsp:Transcript_138659/g.360393  ORF Transcript_138659/g.360393 Transcript_138659/m.360393 type:complete len:217 (+) Transcript_138659:384-1034(+)